MRNLSKKAELYKLSNSVDPEETGPVCGQIELVYEVAGRFPTYDFPNGDLELLGSFEPIARPSDFVSYGNISGIWLMARANVIGFMRSFRMIGHRIYRAPLFYRQETLDYRVVYL